MHPSRYADAVNLSGDWMLAYTMEPEPAPITTVSEMETSGFAVLPAVVPGNLELDLQRNGKIDEPFRGMSIAGLTQLEQATAFYGTSFTSAPRPGHRAILLFEGIDCRADIYLNGKLVASTNNALIPHEIDITDRLRTDNELVVRLAPATEDADKHSYPPGLQAMPHCYDGLYQRKPPHAYGWDIMPRAVTAGIWRPVRLVYVPDAHIGEAYLETLSVAPHGERASLALTCEVTAPRASVREIHLTGECDGSTFECRQRILGSSTRLTFDVPNPRLWWPVGRGDPALYHVRATLLVNGEPADEVCFTHGIRTIELVRTSTTDPQGHGEFCFRVNGERFFAKGTNWVPLDAYHARDIGRLPRAMEMLTEVGCNMVRCWGGNVYESDAFFDECDRRGILVWQDFAMACAIYPQDPAFCQTLTDEARAVVRRLRQHPSLALWAGDNECDQAYSWGGRKRDPNSNVLTRIVLPRVLQDEDPGRPYLPSSPYIDAKAFETGDEYLPENHLWGPRDYFKSPFYTQSMCHFASEIGYHGCPHPDSLRRFLSPDKVWPMQPNEEWILHSTSPVPGVDLFDYRVSLMAQQVRELFGDAPDNVNDFAFASQACQAEAKKFFVELFRSSKWRRTGILWWNLLDGWPQLSDAVVDYYYAKKLAFYFLKRAQEPLTLIVKEPGSWGQDLVAANDTRRDLSVRFRVYDIDTDEVMASGEAVAYADATTPVARLPYLASWKRFYAIEWTSEFGDGRSHFLCGTPPFGLDQYRGWLMKAGFLPKEWMPTE